jgi:hypothetical protein
LARRGAAAKKNPAAPLRSAGRTSSTWIFLAKVGRPVNGLKWDFSHFLKNAHFLPLQPSAQNLN